jgi:hypothetical protein
VKGRVERSDLRQVGERRACLAQAAQRRLVVERRDRPELRDRRLDLRVDEDGLDEARAAVDDAVADCGDARASAMASTGVLVSPSTTCS